MDTKVNYLGLELKSPIIAGSCGLTANVDTMKRMEDSGAGAVILKSIFEEQIIYDIKRNTHVVAPIDKYGASYDYIAQHAAQDALDRHYKLIRDTKASLSIPVVGSINCYSYENWITYAKHFQDAGIDALELNVALMPCDTSLSEDDVEREFGNIIRTLNKVVTIPISIKVSPYYTNMAKFMQHLSWMNVDGITMFNKAVSVDIDIEKEDFVMTSKLSEPNDIYHTLRWVAILSKTVRCPISASTGVATSDDVVKMLLAGAQTVQVVSALYRHDVEYLKTLNEGLRNWMAHKGYERIADFCGKMALARSSDASMLMRTQFMRYFSEIE